MFRPARLYLDIYYALTCTKLARKLLLKEFWGNICLVFSYFSVKVAKNMKHVFLATFTGKAVRRRGVTFMST